MKKLLAFFGCFCLCVMVLGIVEASSTITISSITKSLDPVACTLTIGWTTSECTDNNVVKWDNTPCNQSPTFPNSEVEGGGGKTSHSVTFDVSGATGVKIAFKIESSNDCDSGSSSCGPATVRPCAG